MHYVHASRSSRLPVVVAGVVLALAALPAGAEEAAETPPAIELPGAEPVAPDLRRRLWSAYRDHGPDYEPRTEHLQPDGSPEYVNRLILEDSPYLIQHAHNPVNWYPWGEEAFEKARLENKPVFLSIGYSTCHWCHVMERESFDHVEVARLLNESFVAIKVDREQRPDVDEIYMTAVLLMRRRGGWPMSTLLTPEGEPFFGGTYFPRAEFMSLLNQASTAWLHDQPQLRTVAERTAKRVAQVTAAAGKASEVGADAIEAAVRRSLARHDGRLGGFSGAPKFPHEPELLFLLERVLRTGDREALAAVETSLDHMARGGIYDQVGGGFHRYSTDARWLVPHFEKMLYNQAHLARAYLEAYRLTGDPLYERVARQTLDYVLRDMTSPEGGFYSATDADSEGEEGKFFVWTPDEIRAALLAADAEFAIELFGVTAAGNFEDRTTILNLPRPLPEVAAAHDLTLPQLFERVDRIRRRLYEVRERRIHPLRDDKVVTAWNGMMITSLARAGDLLGEARYLEVAERASEFLWRHNRRKGGGLWRVHLEGSSSVIAGLEDYSYLAEALVSLYDATGRREWLERADATAREMVARFHDPERGGFYMSEDDEGGRLIARPKSPTDGAIPSGNSVAVHALALLAARTGESEHRRHAETTIAAFSQQIGQQPTGFAYMLLGADELLHAGAGPLEYGAHGTVRAKAVVDGWQDGRGALAVELETAEGWHVNAHRPLQDSLIPTALALAGEADGFALDTVEYPPAETVTLGFQEEPLAVYQGRVPIRGALVADGAGRSSIVRLTITVQACDDEKCLRPEDLVLELPVPGESPAGSDGSASSPGSSSTAVVGAVTGLVTVVAAAAWWLWWRPAHAA